MALFLRVPAARAGAIARPGEPDAPTGPAPQLSRHQSFVTIGLVPGCEIRVIQRYPSSMIGVGETVLALESDVAGEIVVRLREAALVS
jgi:Fe2+ transport system protein FeoA